MLKKKIAVALAALGLSMAASAQDAGLIITKWVSGNGGVISFELDNSAELHGLQFVIDLGSVNVPKGTECNFTMKGAIGACSAHKNEIRFAAVGTEALPSGIAGFVNVSGLDLASLDMELHQTKFRGVNAKVATGEILQDEQPIGMWRGTERVAQ